MGEHAQRKPAQGYRRCVMWLVHDPGLCSLSGLWGWSLHPCSHGDAASPSWQSSLPKSVRGLRRAVRVDEKRAGRPAAGRSGRWRSCVDARPAPCFVCPAPDLIVSGPFGPHGVRRPDCPGYQDHGSWQLFIALIFESNVWTVHDVVRARVVFVALQKADS